VIHENLVNQQLDPVCLESTIVGSNELCCRTGLSDHGLLVGTPGHWRSEEKNHESRYGFSVDTIIGEVCVGHHLDFILGL
jgi:hypothetical protein